MESIAIIQEAETRKSRKSAKSSSSIPSGVNGAIGASLSTENRSHTAKPTVHPQQEKQDKSRNNETHNRKGKVQKSYSFYRFWRPIPRMLACMLRPEMRGKRSQDEQSPSQSLSSLFFALPTELQLEIITQLSINDISRLRQTSQAFSALIELHEGHIVKENIQKWVPKYISMLFPLPDTAPATLKYLQEITYRREESDSLAEVLAQRIVREMGKSRAQKAPVCPKVLEYVVEQLKLGFSPLILAIFHFLETYHRRKSQELSGTGPFNGSTLEDKEREIQSDIMLQYPDYLLLQIHQMYHLLLHLLTRRLTLTSWYSRPVRRWHVASVTGRPDDEALAKLLLLGGIPEVSRLHKLKGCGKRRKELEKYLKKTANQSQGEPPMKFHGGTIKDGISINIDKLGQIWVPAAEKQLLSRGIVTDLDSIRCCGEFVAELLGDEFTTATEKTTNETGEISEDPAQQPAQIIAALRFGHTHLRFEDDGNWDRDLILEGEDDFDDDLGENELKEKEECEVKRPTTPVSKPVAGPSRSPGTIVGLTTPVPGCAGNGYNGMGANFMNMTL